MSRNTARVRLEELEHRDVPASVSLNGSILTIQGDGSPDNFSVSSIGGVVIAQQALADGSYRTWSVPASRVGSIRFNGEGGNDRFGNQTYYPCTAYGGAGDDLIVGGYVTDKIYGGIGNDWLYGNYGDDTINGESGNDQLYGNDGVDRLYCGDADPNFSAWADAADGGYGDDYLYGGSGTQYLVGNYDNDHLYGGGGNDYLYGSDGNDYLYGQGDNDLLWGGPGADTMDGGSGYDTGYWDNYYDSFSSVENPLYG